MTTVTFVYPEWMKERYNPQVVQTGKRFSALLFAPDQLPEVTHPDFKERIAGEGVTLDGLPALQAYRQRLGKPVLRGITMIAIAPHLAMTIPDGTQRRYTLDHLMELSFGLKPEDLPPGSPPVPEDTPLIHVVVRLREPYLIRRATLFDKPVSGTDPDQLWVFERTYQPIGAEGFLADPHGQHEFVRQQVTYYAQNGRTMVEDGRILSIEEIYEREFGQRS